MSSCPLRMYKKSKFNRDFRQVSGNPFPTDVIWCPKRRKGVKVVPVSWCYIKLLFVCVCVRARVRACVPASVRACVVPKTVWLYNCASAVFMCNGGSLTDVIPQTRSLRAGHTRIESKKASCRACHTQDYNMTMQLPLLKGAAVLRQHDN